MLRRSAATALGVVPPIDRSVPESLPTAALDDLKAVIRRVR